jgi:hypothetical protein
MLVEMTLMLVFSWTYAKTLLAIAESPVKVHGGASKAETIRKDRKIKASCCSIIETALNISD